MKACNIITNQCPEWFLFYCQKIWNLVILSNNNILVFLLNYLRLIYNFLLDIYFPKGKFFINFFSNNFFLFSGQWCGFIIFNLLISTDIIYTDAHSIIYFMTTLIDHIFVFIFLSRTLFNFSVFWGRLSFWIFRLNFIILRKGFGLYERYLYAWQIILIFLILQIHHI